MRKVLHILYSGLGGHASVFFSLLQGQRLALIEQPENPLGPWQQAGLFYGVEAVVPDYLQRCAEEGVDATSVLKRQGLDRQAEVALDRAIADSTPDAIVVHVPQALGSALRWRRRHPRCRVVMVEHHPNQLKGWPDWWRSARGLWQADSVVFLTNAHREEVAQRLGPLFRQEKTVLIPNGLDVHHWQPVSASLARDHSRQCLGMCTRVSDQKDIDTLLRAFATLVHADHSAAASPEAAPWHLLIAGDGPERAKLETLASELSLEPFVHFLGMLDEEALLPFYQSLDVYVHATCAETMSTSVMQALACGLPVVVSDIAGMDTLVPADVGLRVPPREVESLAGAMSSLMTQPALRDQFGAAARHFAVQRLACEVSWRAYRQCFD